MQASTKTVIALAEQIAAEHAAPHTCTNGEWYNPRAVTSGPCPTALILEALMVTARQTDAAVHGAAHDPEAVDHVATAMLTTPIAELDREPAAAWRYLARLAVEGLAAWLDADVPTT